LSDSTPTAHLDYDTERDPGAGRLVRSYRVGAASIRRDGESWEELGRGSVPCGRPTSLRRLGRSIPPSPRSIRWPAPVERLIAAARAAGFRVRVTEAYRSPERQAYLMVKGGGLTFTATSMHSTGHAVDLVVGDGDLHIPGRGPAGSRSAAGWPDSRVGASAFSARRSAPGTGPMSSWPTGPWLPIGRELLRAARR
jgi:hypothetical protein